MTLGLTSGHLLCRNMVILVKPKINYSLFISFRGNAVANVKKYNAALKSEKCYVPVRRRVFLSNWQLFNLYCVK